MRKRPENFVTDNAAQLALRQLRRDLAQPQTLAAFAGIGVILAILAPFGTDDALRAVPRTLYWLAIVAVTYAIGALVNVGVITVTKDRLTQPMRVTAAACANALVVPPVVWGINGVLFGQMPAPLGFFLTAGALAALVTVLLNILDPPKAAQTRPPAILDRLPMDKRGALVAISVEDHYVRIRTTAGEAIVLMRLSDAIRETSPVVGLQVHRSHWVAIEAVRSVARQGDRAILTMKVGDPIPASRSNVPALRKTGLLP